ncbi:MULTISPECIES: PTS sugar transporter subunit IIB [Tissierellales]|jgi:PTS system galactitol-specific IIB component|uniref:PTS galactitol transporter subunit IIB n=1 Tax=Acidilutibacter cellobiosedens TaxID=2507161 RepID=A0A410QBX8_9FIRM|nr:MULTISPECIES: PTS sugar transporter subunit IIB [Tissierellales]MBE6083662.1 PTS galactitol transporter subunit IIB [Tissierellaceae bacterium]QAT61496.1 PTS galactitol transporter subunit IIB [Acidilutibacter cellobiosedens]SCL83728.1 Galactitol-specific phosphotransferase enzyme IIB component [Sporanaerobacter sp. PP17-6a]
MKTYKILVSCGSGIATSTVIANRVKKLCEDNEIDVSIKQVKIVEVEKLAPDYDLIVSSTRVPNTVKTPSIFAISYLTGVNQEATDKEVVSKLKHIVEK